ncbi:hypothetical protein C8J56DRAFT_912433 [Mycena floridula]|nr:hypothetical protein C8J56DRAFT_912433 [Mycena floridula]
MEIVSNLEPPHYPSPPAYSHSPGPDEQCIAQTRSRVTSFSSTYTRTIGDATLVLFNQRANTVHPVYGRNGLIDGVLRLKRTEQIQDISIQLNGQMTCSVARARPEVIRLVDITHTLWNDADSVIPCPTTIPFCIVQSPSRTFQDGEGSFDLPPSYQFLRGQEESKKIHVSCVYTLTLSIVKGTDSSRNLIPWSKSRRCRFDIPMQYQPRSRPPRPISASLPCLGTLKSMMDDWHQSIFEMKAQPSKLDSLWCNLLVPEGRIYGVSECIPFHLQISGPTSSLDMLVPSNSSLDISVTLMRQVTVARGGRKAWQNTTMGKAKICALPPDLDCDDDSDCLSLNWEGHLCCTNQDALMGGFEAAGVAVKDFILVSITSMGYPDSPFLPFRNAVAIRLTSHPWTYGPS